MKRFRINGLVVMAVFMVLAGAGLVSATSPPQKGDVLPELNLSVPQDPEHRSYLGVSGQGVFQVPQIKAEVVLVEVFSMYCPACQKEAPHVNELYKMIEADPQTRGRIKLIGVGAGNTPFEVEVFRKKYEVPFPLFADADFAMHRSLGEVRTPYFIGVRIKDGRPEIFYTLLGSFESPAEFLQLLLKSCE